MLLEAAPRGADLADVRSHILGVDGVVGVHDLHAWTITSGLPVLSAHVVVTDEALDAGHGGRNSTRSASAWVSTSTWRTAPSNSRAGTHAGHESPVHDWVG